jgi:ribosomal protein S18 acetylase RimI-like enzyme
MKFSVREYRATDFDRLWEIDQLCFPHGISYTQMELSGFITSRNSRTLVAEFEKPHLETDELGVAKLQSDDGRTSHTPADESSAARSSARNLAGFVIAHAVRGKSGRILTLDIIPCARRLGLASQLMDECERRLRSYGCQQMYLETAVTNEPALRLYQKLGYQILRTLPDYYSSHSLDAYLMVKPL